MPPKIEAAKTATFDADDKRAQYARLAVFNYGVQEKIISKDSTVNDVKAADMQKAFKSLTGGSLLDGKEGIELVQKLTKANAEDPKVAERGLTTAYAQEVRPFLKRGVLSPSFGRRGGLTPEEKAKREEERAAAKAKRDEEKAAKKAERERVAAEKKAEKEAAAAKKKEEAEAAAAAAAAESDES